MQKIGGKQIHEQSGSRHGQSEFNTIGIHRSSQQHFSDTSSHERVRSGTSLARQGSSHGQSEEIQGQSGFRINKRQVHSHGQSSDSYGQSSDSRNTSQSSISSHSLDSQDPTGTEEYSCRYSSSSTTTQSGERQKQESGSSLLGSIKRYSQDVDDKQTRDSETKGYHGRERTDSGSFHLDSNTPLYEYVQEQRCYYFE
ncbi:hypothetical protein HPG69_010594 [Diceros bicornis minor]|uniref:Uncharacterized protein n=1 Tax=Diceros bicornis minor TaxID=77932 RepID=A0A7J7EKT1_DICBM|nr:hypothetical protein HPG69_010594 [Diceros bicornis minor]